MWFRLAGADWSGDGNSLGSMSSISGSWTVQCTTSGGISKTTGAGFVTQGGTWTGTFTLATGAEFTSAILTPSSAGTVTSTPSGSTVTITIANVSANCTLSVVATGGSGGSDTPVNPTKYTITYKYMSGSTSIKTQTTEEVTAGTTRTFSTSGAPSVSGYTCTSVSPSGQQTINSNITVTYYYTANAVGERVTIAEKADYSLAGFCRPTNGSFGGTTDTSYKRTDYIDITAYSTLYAYCQPRATSVSPISFFDAEKVWIKGITPDSATVTEQQEFTADVPANAVYAIFSGFANSNPLKAEGILK